MIKKTAYIIINSYDIETYLDDDNKHVAYCICIYIGENFKHFYKEENNNNVIEDSIKYLLENFTNSNLIIYIHNINFDGMLLLSYLSNQHKYTFEVNIQNINIYSLTIYEKHDKFINFRCSYKLIPISLNNIAKSFKTLPKMPFPYKFSSYKNLNYIGKLPHKKYFESEQTYAAMANIEIFDFKKYSIEYCKRDVLITKEAISKITEIIKTLKISLDNIYSAPSLSYNIFFHKFNNNKLKTKTSINLDSIIRPSYFGGRCEVFGNATKHEQIFHFDFSGMYGRCMLEKFCFGKHKTFFFTNNEKCDFNEPGFYSISYTSVNINIPILPHHNFANKKLMFTNGEMSGIYWFEEINLFIQNGGIINKIFFKITFEHYEEVFTEFVNFFTKIRELGGAYKTFGKLIINSLYGRMGMGIDEYYSFFIKKNELSYYENTHLIENRKELNDIILIKCEINKALKNKFKIKPNIVNSNVAIASAITSKARIKLYHAYMNVNMNKGRVLYSDTDSVFAAYKENVLGQTHGEIFWDPNDSKTIINEAIFISPKTYAIKTNNTTEIKIKGINEIKLSFNDLKKKFYSDNDQEKIIFKNRHLKKSNLNLKEETVHKEILINTYDKRRFTSDKKNTVALKYENYIYI